MRRGRRTNVVLRDSRGHDAGLNASKPEDERTQTSLCLLPLLSPLLRYNRSLQHSSTHYNLDKTLAKCLFGTCRLFFKIKKRANMSGFGQWYEEQKAQEAAPADGEGGDQLLPLWGDTSQYSFGSLRSSMEAQMPQQILGMNYQQRFRVSNGAYRLFA